ncbi:MAG TPA: tripartite tricarboxylate transporter TctB family protein [Pseudolabrys sp.]|nr:tripartite tricarboxylate transporter TctB family protein [Pseudolabrys sp.]
MNQTVKETGGTGPSHRNVEIGVAAFMALLALVGIFGSLKVGIGWGDEGPRAGFFPFYVSLVVLASCIINIISVLTTIPRTRVFAEWGQLRQVVSVLAPTVVYVTLVPYIGIYVASALLIAFFMLWFGRYNLITSAAVAVVVPVLTFLMFEIWFLVPLPKGVLESMLGF